MFRGRLRLRVLQAARLRSYELRRARLGFSCVGRAMRSLQAKRGGARRDRTDDLMLAKHALSQLSYGPVTRRRMLRAELERHMHSIKWWAWEDLNFRPHAYQARALTN